MKTVFNLFATTPKGLELLLVEELKSLGATTAAEKLAGVAFTGDLACAYRVCLWSRLANRILLKIAEFPGKTPEELYANVQTISWEDYLSPEGTLAVKFVCSNSDITHTLFGAQKVKDAIVDQFRRKFGVRPNVDREHPDVCIYVYLNKNMATISLDLSGESLHRRGYRLSAGEAPLKENLAAAILLRAGWKDILKKEGTLIDPLCGSGTLLIEAALMAGDIAPGLLRSYFGFLGWKKHDAILWDELIQDAKKRCEVGLNNMPTIIGYDIDSQAIKNAFENIERANLRGKIHVEKRELAALMSKQTLKPGLIVTNPPYGQRLGEIPQLKKLYEQLGDALKQHFTGWRAAVFTGNPDLGKNMGIRSRKTYALFNGAIPSQLLLFDVQPEWFVDRSPAANNERRIRKAKKIFAESDPALIQDFINRLRKNVKHLKRKAERENLFCYRIYDEDLPEYAVTIDCYGEYILVEAYPVPRFMQQTAEKRLQYVLAVLPETLEVAAGNIYLREQDSEEDYPFERRDDLVFKK